MPIKKTNLLLADKILHIGDEPSIHPKAMPMQAPAIMQKSHDLLNQGEKGREILILLRSKRNGRSLLMQQSFENKDTICALVDPDGEVTHFDADGAAMTGTPDSLGNDFWQAWDDVTVTGDEYKIAVVLSCEAYKEYAENAMDHKKDARFVPALTAIHNRMQPVRA